IAPSAPRARAIALPIPREEPVTTATLPASRFCVVPFTCGFSPARSCTPWSWRIAHTLRRSTLRTYRRARKRSGAYPVFTSRYRDARDQFLHSDEHRVDHL